MKTIDWEQRRYEIAKEVLPSILNKMEIIKTNTAVSLSINCANILIRRLKEIRQTISIWHKKDGYALDVER